MFPSTRLPFQKSFALALVSSLPHVVAVLTSFVYNTLVQRAYPAEFGDRSAFLPVGIMYCALSLSFGVIVGTLLSRRLKAALARPSPALDPGEPVLMFLLFRAMSSTLCWLLAIPVFGLFALHTYGRLHPLGFPHFCASVVVGWLVSTTYSTLLCVSRLSVILPTAQPSPRATLLAAARYLPITASGVPFVAALMFLFFASPGLYPTSAYNALQGLLVGVMTFGGYGFVYCAQLTDQLSGRER